MVGVAVRPVVIVGDWEHENRVQHCEAKAVSEWASLVAVMVARIQRELHTLVRSADGRRLDKPPVPGANPIGWMAWHLTRSHDRNMSELVGREQLWIADGWHARFGRDADPADTGFGHTPADVAAFNCPDPNVILDYHDTVVNMILGYLEDAPADDLRREVFSPTLSNTATVEERISGFLVDALQHLGQIGYARGMLESTTAHNTDD